MIGVEYRHRWGSGTTREQEMAEKFGQLLVDYDTADGYDVEESYLFYDGEIYTWLDADGCSCWDGSYDGWELNKKELKKIAQEKVNNKYRDSASVLVAEWILGNIK